MVGFNGSKIISLILIFDLDLSVDKIVWFLGQGNDPSFSSFNLNFNSLVPLYIEKFKLVVKHLKE